MIIDKNEFDSFVEWLPSLKKDEVYFASLSARSKYLSPAERLEYSSGRTEMFSRFTAYDKTGLALLMKKLQATLLYRTTRNGKSIPTKSLVTYINVNPSSMLQALTTFKAEVDRMQLEYIKALESKKNIENVMPIVRAQKTLLNCIQKSRSRKVIIDVDIDDKDISVTEELCTFLLSQGVESKVIMTHGGYHVLIKRDELRANNVNLWNEVSRLDKIAEGEVVINKNGMVPVPGTLQSNHLVRTI